MTSVDSFNSRQKLVVGDRTYDYFSLTAAEANGLTGVSRLPYSLKVVLENLLRNEDGRWVTKDTILDFAKKISELSGQNGRVQFRIKKQSYVNSPNRIIVPNTLKLRELGWNQEVTLDESISKTLIWIQNQIT